MTDPLTELTRMKDASRTKLNLAREAAAEARELSKRRDLQEQLAEQEHARNVALLNAAWRERSPFAGVRK